MRKICLIAGLLWVASLVSAGPISTCTVTAGVPGFVCDIFETLADGTPSDISNIITLPNPVVAGYLVLFEEGVVGDQTDITTWSDVLHFFDDGGGLGAEMQLLSAGCNIASGDRSCFPTAVTVAGVPNAFLAETDPVTTFAGGNTYNIHSDDVNDATAPEPGSIGLMGAGLAGVALLVRKRKQRA